MKEILVVTCKLLCVCLCLCLCVTVTGSVETGLVHSITMYSTLRERSNMWLPQGGALKIENLQFTQYSIIVLLSMLYLILNISHW